MKSKRVLFFILQLFFIEVSFSAIIPDSRMISWDAGVRGGIPNRTTICSTINAATQGGEEESCEPGAG